MSFDFGDNLTDSRKPVVLEEEHYDGQCRIKELILKVSGVRSCEYFLENANVEDVYRIDRWNTKARDEKCYRNITSHCLE